MKTTVVSGAATAAAAAVALVLSGAALAAAKDKAPHAAKPPAEKSACGGKNGCGAKTKLQEGSGAETSSSGDKKSGDAK